MALLNRHLVHRRVAVYTTGATALIGLAASLAVLDAERDAPGASITTLAELRREPRAAVGEARARASGTGETSFTDERRSVR